MGSDLEMRSACIADQARTDGSVDMASGVTTLLVDPSPVENDRMTLYASRWHGSVTNHRLWWLNWLLNRLACHAAAYAYIVITISAVTAKET